MKLKVYWALAALVFMGLNLWGIYRMGFNAGVEHANWACPGNPVSVVITDKTSRVCTYDSKSFHHRPVRKIHYVKS